MANEYTILILKALFEYLFVWIFRYVNMYFFACVIADYSAHALVSHFLHPHDLFIWFIGMNDANGIKISLISSPFAAWFAILEEEEEGK